MFDDIDINVLIKQFPLHDLHLITNAHNKEQLWAGHKLILNWPTEDVIRDIARHYCQSDVYNLLIEEIERCLNEKHFSVNDLKNILGGI